MWRLTVRLGLWRLTMKTAEVKAPRLCHKEVSVLQMSSILMTMLATVVVLAFVVITVVTMVVISSNVHRLVGILTNAL